MSSFNVSDEIGIRLVATYQLLMRFWLRIKSYFKKSTYLLPKILDCLNYSSLTLFLRNCFFSICKKRFEKEDKIRGHGHITIVPKIINL